LEHRFSRILEIKDSQLEKVNLPDLAGCVSALAATGVLPTDILNDPDDPADVHLPQMRTL